MQTVDKVILKQRKGLGNKSVSQMESAGDVAVCRQTSPKGCCYAVPVLSPRKTVGFKAFAAGTYGLFFCLSKLKTPFST